MLLAAAIGCSVGAKDLERWETTLEGPKRLSAVVLYDKYPHGLRVDAAMRLIDMKARKGQRVGIDRLVKGTLVCDPTWLEKKMDEPCGKTRLSPDTRAKILTDLVPKIVAELKKPPPPAQNNQAAADPSYKYKDAAYMMLTYDKTQIIADGALKQQLVDALKEWAMVDFARKLNDQTQMFGMEQLLRLIGPSSVEKLPELMNKNSLRDMGRMADLIEKLGDEKTKDEAGKKLVAIVKEIDSPAWRKEKEPEVKAANDARQLQPTDKQFQQQLEDYQVDTLTKVLDSMRKVGGPTAVDYCLTLVADKSKSLKVRQAASTALTGHLDKKDTKSIDRLVAIAKNKDTPLPITDMAFRLLKQLPREAVIKQLYELLDIDDWKIRRLAGSTILQMSKVAHIDEFLAEISKRAKKSFNLGEAQTYAAYIADLKEGNPLDKLKPHLKDERIQARVVALMYYFVKGTKADIAAVKAFADDKDKIPKCDEKDKDCSWECNVAAPDKKNEFKAAETVGDIVGLCVVPQINRAATAKKDDKPKQDKPEDSPKEGGGE
jgi:hypothetical protein